ncbi:hypothetical protein TD95_002379 [Thielaviopsis punctulata]|uniref:Vacuolar calcium ion transporter n=1 Tax=Thielaviopsis punctulata TaxID=72032 RepID=A0A0F4ZHF0_9PEZI|nr:hypothetical protein TD95_002379 [Thielaviopsis punctulata]
MSRPRGRSSTGNRRSTDDRNYYTSSPGPPSSHPRPPPHRSRSRGAYEPAAYDDPSPPPSPQTLREQRQRRQRRESMRRSTSSRRAAAPPPPPRHVHEVASDESLPVHTHPGVKRYRWIQRAGESYRTGFNPAKFFMIVLRSTSRLSMLCNFLWPIVPVALAIRYAFPTHHILIFALSYVAMIPCANLVGFSGTELARKLPHVFGVLVEVTLGSIVEIVLFMVLLSHDQFSVIKAAVLGSILATMLLCLGMCFIVGGAKRDEQGFSDAISETGSGLLLTAGVALSVPSIFTHSLSSSISDTEDLEHRTLQISRAVSLCLIFAYIVYAYFQAHTHHGIFDAIFEDDEKQNENYHEDKHKPRLTLTEVLIALSVSLALVTLIAISLVKEIEPIVEDKGISDPFMGLIMVPLVEKFAEHLGAINEAYDNQMNFALSHVLGATIQTALFNGPLTIIVAWCLHKEMDLTFVVFDIAMLLLSIITVGGFLRDQKSNYLEGILCITLYISIAMAAFFYPNLHATEGTGEAEAEHRRMLAMMMG